MKGIKFFALSIVLVGFTVLTPASFAQMENAQLDLLEDGVVSPDDEMHFGFMKELVDERDAKRQKVYYGDDEPEEYPHNGIDDDGDGAIDEQILPDHVQIAIYNTDKRPDDEWSVRVDDKFLGTYLKGKSRFWNVNLAPGKHKVSVRGVFAPDHSGNYSIWFNNCKVVKGPPQEQFNLSEEILYTWVIEVPEKASE